MVNGKRRSILVIALIVLGALLLLIGLVAAYAREAALDPQGLAESANGARMDESVSDLIAETLERQLVEDIKPELISFRPVIENAISGAVRSPAFDEIFTLAIADLHSSFFDEGSDTIALDLANVGVVAQGLLASSNPELAAQLPADFEAGLVSIAEQSASTEVLQIAETIEEIAFVAPLLALLAFALAIWLSRDRRQAVFRVGVSVGIVGVLLVFAVITGRAVFLDALDSGLVRDAGAAVFDAFIGELVVWAAILGGLGAVIAGAAASVLRPIDVRDHAERVGEWASRRPETTLGLVARAVAIAAASLFLIFEHETALRLLLLAAGLYGLVWAFSEIFQLTFKPEPDGAAADETSGASGRRIAWGPRLIGGAAALAALALGILVIARRPGGDELAAVLSSGCNGHETLCERTLDEVTFATTHNSMSSADAGFLIPSHTGTIIDQLDFGIRGLLVDVWRAAPREDGLVETDLGGQTREDIVAELGESTVEAVERLRGRELSFDGSEIEGAQLYLCHQMCEIGAAPLEPALREIRGWLDRHPRDVVILFIQDQTASELIESSIEASGLAERAWDGDLGPGSAMPTLGEMIDADKRVVIMDENDGGATAWYHDGFVVAQDTPFDHKSPDDMSCDRLRGQSDSPLFLVNHWVATIPPNPTDAAVVNEHAFLLERAQRCERERGLQPTLLAVDFYETGDVLGVTDVLNGVGPAGDLAEG